MSMPTETMEIMTTKPAAGKGAAAKPGKREGSGACAAERELALEMIRRAKERGLDPTGPDGPLRQFTGTVPETALDEEMTEHPGRAKHEKSAGTQREHAQQHHRQDGHDRRRGARHHRGAA